jgi:FkbM family methyltransferase
VNGIALPILRGPLRGARWLPASGGKLARLLLGSYEREQSERLRQCATRGAVVYDVGANAGYYALLASRLVGPRGRVVAFEPEPRNAAFLREHVRLNDAANVEVVEAAAGDTAGERGFARRGTGRGRLDERGELRVRVVRLDDCIAGGMPTPSLIKIDVEGGELAVLEGAAQLLAGTRPVLLLSTHARAVHDACCRRLRELGYLLTPLGGRLLAEAGELFCAPAAGPDRHEARSSCSERRANATSGTNRGNAPE